VVVLNLAEHHNRERFKLRVVCLEGTGGLAKAVEKAGIPVESLDCRGLPKARTLLRLTRRLRRIRPDILHTHNMNPHFFGAIAAPLACVPHVLHTKHGRNYPDQLRAVLRNRFSSLLTDQIVTVSEDAARVVRDIERVPARKVAVIRNGVDLHRFSVPDSRVARTGMHGIHVARLNVSKDQRTLLTACRSVVDKFPAFRLSIVGDGPEREQLVALREELGLIGQVDFLGERHDVPSLLAAADFFVLSSVEEGIPLTVLEAMASGLAVVATRVGGNPEAIIPNETGLLVDSGSPSELATAIVTLLRSPDAALRMGIAGRERAEKYFDVRVVTSSYESMYRELVMPDSSLAR
jgi:glycosyltransferase involved in cell wall biosynthesis